MPTPDSPSRSSFALGPGLAAKADPALVGADERHFSAVLTCLDASLEDVSRRLSATLRSPAGSGQEALDRDQEVHRLGARLRTLRRHGLDLVLGRTVTEDGTTTYVGRVGLADDEGRRLLVDWRSPAAEPFFGATLADPRGVVSRRRYRWSGGQVSDYWDEVFSGDVADHAALDDQSAFIASLGRSRSPRMHDVLATIAADQDAVVRAGSRGALVVDGGPGTGKTVVALHRTAYLLHADPRLGHRRGGVLFVGPHQPYLTYVGDVLPSLGEEGVLTCTLRDLVPEGATAGEEADPHVARLKASAALTQAVDPAVRFHEQPPREGLEVTTPWCDLWVGPEDWATAFEAVEPGVPHNEARDQVWQELVALLLDTLDEDADVPEEQLRAALARDPDLVDAFTRAWPLVEHTDLVADLWSVPAYLRLCAPALDAEEVSALQRQDPYAWTLADLPLLDAARARLGDPDASRRARERVAAEADERAQVAEVVEDLLQLDTSGDEYGTGLLAMLRQDDLRERLLDVPEHVPTSRERLTGPFAHVVVDEAQELDDAEWAMVLRRCPSRSLTIVGDRAQARRGFAESWQQRLTRVGVDDVRVATLGVNYRTPQEVMDEAEPVVRAVVPDANVPASVRSTGVPVRHGRASDLDQVLRTWLEEHPTGTACVVGAPQAVAIDERVRSLAPALVKGLEFDLVVLVDPASFGDGATGAVDRYVAMTRATQQLVVLTTS